MNRFVRKNSVVLFIGFIIIYLITVVSGMMFPGSDIYINLMGILSVAMMLWVTYCFRNNTALFICFFMVFYSIYSVYLAVYVFPELRPEFMYKQISDELVYQNGLQCIFLFSLTVFFLVLNGITDGSISFERKQTTVRQMRYNPFIAIGAVIVIVYIMLTNVTLGGTTARMGVTALFEYKTVFFILGMMYSGNSKRARLFWLIFAIIAGVMSIMGGNRAEALPLFLAYVFMYNNDIKPKYSIIGVSAGIFLMISIGVFRQNFLRGAFDLQTALEKIGREKLTFNTSYWAYAPSVESVDLAGKISLAEKLRVLWGNIVYVILGSQSSGGRYTLTNYVGRHYVQMGGYVSPTYFYFWFKSLGGVLLGLLVYFYIGILDRFENGRFKEKNAFKYMAVSAFFVSTVGRWFLYSPLPLIRGQLIMLTATVLVGAFDCAYSQITRRRSARV